MLSNFVALLLCVGLIVLWSMLKSLKLEVKRLKFGLDVLSFREWFYRKYRGYLNSSKLDTMSFQEFLMHYGKNSVLPFYEVNAFPGNNGDTINVRISKDGLTTTIPFPVFGFKKD